MKRVAPRPDGFESGLRLGCGGLVGVALGVLLAFQLRGSPGLAIVAVCALGVAVPFALLAWRFGDGFWQKLADFLWWCWPW